MNVNLSKTKDSYWVAVYVGRASLPVESNVEDSAPSGCSVDES